MLLFAARVTDDHICSMVTGVVPHVGGPILAPGCPTVLIGGLPAACVGDVLTCKVPSDMIARGSSTVLIGQRPAARVTDPTAHGGMIVTGCHSVLIGGDASAGDAFQPPPSLIQRALDEGAETVASAYSELESRAKSLWNSSKEAGKSGLDTLASMWESLEEDVVHVWRKATAWHFEARDARNGGPPSHAEVTEPGSGWVLLPEEMSIYHDNDAGKPELKYVNEDGRESVFDGDTLELITDPQYKGTYNYVVPSVPPDTVTDISGWLDFAGKGIGHFFADVLPYWAGGNVRGEH